MDHTDPTGDDAICVYQGDCQTLLNVNNVPGNLKLTGEIIGVAGLADGIGEAAEGGPILSKIGQVVKGIRRLFGTAEDVNAVDREVHGSSRASTRAQHRCEIFDKSTGDVQKTGISG